MPNVLSRLGARLKPIERTNKKFWFAVLRRLWNNVPAAKLDPAGVQRVLFLRYDALGDMITTQPAFALLKSLNPGIAIDVLASPRNRRVIEHDPNVDTIIEMRPGALGLVRAIRAARRHRYDAIICAIFGRSSKVGIIANLIGGARAVKATMQKGPEYDAYFNVQSDAAACLQPMWTRIAHLIADTFDLGERPPAVHPYAAPGEAAPRRVGERLAALGLAGTPFLLVNLSVSHERNVWGEGNFDRLLAWLREHRPSMPVLLLALPADSAVAERLAAHGDGSTVTVYPSIDDVLEVVALIARARVLFSADTGVVHMASAVGCPVVALYCGAVAATDWAPFGVPCRVVVSERVEPVRSITAERAAGALDDLLDELSGAAPGSGGVASGDAAPDGSTPVLSGRHD